MRAALSFLFLAACGGPSSLLQTRAVRLDPGGTTLEDAAAMGADTAIVAEPPKSTTRLRVFLSLRVVDRDSAHAAVRAASSRTDVEGVVLEGLETLVLDDEVARALFGWLTRATPEEKPAEWKAFRPLAVAQLVRDLRRAVREGFRLLAWVSESGERDARFWNLDAIITEPPSSRVVTPGGTPLRTARSGPPLWWAASLAELERAKSVGGAGIVLVGSHPVEKVRQAWH